MGPVQIVPMFPDLVQLNYMPKGTQNQLFKFRALSKLSFLTVFYAKANIGTFNPWTANAPKLRNQNILGLDCKYKASRDDVSQESTVLSPYPK